MPKRFWRNEVIQFALDRDVEEAKAEQRAILARDPRNSHAHHALGTLAHFRGQTEQAIQLFSKAIELNTDSPAPHVSLGRLYALRGEYELAWKHARAAASLGQRELVELLER